VRLFGKALLHVGEILGEQSLAQGALPLRHVFLLAPAPSTDGSLPATLLNIASRTLHAAELDREWDRIPGVEVLERDEKPELCFWALRLHHEEYPTQALAKILDSDRILFCEKHWEGKPSFREPPAATPVSRRIAAEHLGRELLNRRGSSHFLAAHGGSLAGLFVQLAAALRDASCHRVQVGGCEQTADLIERLTAA
jgi:hypothetical protein